MHPVLFHIGALVIPSYGAVTALGVLLALGLAQRTARVASRDTNLDAGKVWNLCILSLFAALAAARLLLVIVNWSALRLHPAWLLGLAMVHHPLLAGTGALAGAACALWYARRNKLPLGATADALASPLALGLAFEQLGALASGSGYGVEAATRPALGCDLHESAGRHSGAARRSASRCIPCRLMLRSRFSRSPCLLLVWLPAERRKGDVAGLGLMGAGTSHLHHRTLARSRGRGSLLHGALDGPQIAAVLLVIAGALVLRERKAAPVAENGRGSMSDTRTIDVPAEAQRPAPRSLSGYATRRREPLARANAHRPGRRAGGRRSRTRLR